MINMLLSQILAFTMQGKIQQSHIKITNLKYQLKHGMKKLNCLMTHFMYKILKTFLKIS